MLVLYALLISCLSGAPMPVSICNKIDYPDKANKFAQCLLGMVPTRDDSKFIATVESTWASLGFGDGLLMRYKNKDDFGEPHSAFTICCFWGVKALAQIGKVDEARKHFEQLLSDANHLGLLAEDLEIKSRRQLGNFPQAYSHLALIDAALELEKSAD
jgi:GH15 family glucan-1,4-alpha-glucosidase